MSDKPPLSLCKAERISSRKVLEELFSGRHRSLSSYPLRAIYMPRPDKGVSILVSVSKRHFKRAVQRNRIKRQLREAYRLNKDILADLDKGLCIAFLWRESSIMPSALVSDKVRSIRHRIHEAEQNVESNL